MDGILLKEEALNTSQNEPVPFSSLPTKNTIPVVINITMIPKMGLKIMAIKKIQIYEKSGYNAVSRNPENAPAI